MAANWTITWDSATPDAAAFKADLRLGDYYSVTDAGTMGGISMQTFSTSPTTSAALPAGTPPRAP